MSKRKPQRPRLEIARGSEICGRWNWDGAVWPVRIHDNEGREVLAINSRDITRLRKFLEKCEAYLEARKERK